MDYNTTPLIPYTHYYCKKKKEEEKKKKKALLFIAYLEIPQI